MARGAWGSAVVCVGLVGALWWTQATLPHAAAVFTPTPSTAHSLPTEAGPMTGADTKGPKAATRVVDPKAPWMGSSGDPIPGNRDAPTGNPTFMGVDPDAVLRRLADRDQIAFLTIGDWGRNTPEKAVLADTMARWAEREDAAFIISCGDSFYSSSTHKHHGIAAVDDPYIKECFEDPFHHVALQRKWFVSIGNHDYPPHAPKGNIPAQVQYTNVSKRWYLPAPYYTYRMQAKGWSVELFVIDHYDPAEYDTLRLPDPYPVQLPWLDRKLAASTAEWKVVVCHRPFYSSGKWHGAYPRWKKAIYPILLKHRVQVYFAGDDHILEALRDPSGLVLFVSGAGGHMHPFGRPDRHSLFKSNKHGFTFHTLNRSHLHSKLVGYRDQVLYEFTTAVDAIQPPAP
jgi:tartrate-resistant acid phosphatase type 5